MKQLGFTLVIVTLLIVMLAGADFRTSREEVIKVVPKGCGYTIIEAGRGIDCNGDTIVITKIHPEIAAL